MRFQRKKDVVARDVAGAHLLIPVQGSARSVFTLNPAGLRLWELLEESKSVDELAVALAAQYRLPAEQAEQDVRAFLIEMERKQLVEVVTC